MVEAQHPLVATPCAGIEVQLPFGIHRICAVAAASTAAEMRKLVRQAMRFSRTIELRLDWLANDAQRQKFMAWIARSGVRDRKSTRLNSSHSSISYAVFCLKKK